MTFILREPFLSTYFLHCCCPPLAIVLASSSARHSKSNLLFLAITFNVYGCKVNVLINTMQIFLKKFSKKVLVPVIVPIFYHIIYDNPNRKKQYRSYNIKLNHPTVK